MQTTCARESIFASVMFLLFAMALTSLGGSPAPLTNKACGITLTPEQVEQFKAFNAEAEAAIEAIKKDVSLSNNEKVEQIRVIRNGIKEKLRAILSTEQVEEFKPHPKGFLVKTLGVLPTPEQEIQFWTILAEAEPAMKTIRENSKLSKAEKEEQMQAIYDDINRKLTDLVNLQAEKRKEANEKK